MNVILTADTLRYPLTGVGRYTFELARELANNPAITQLRYLRGGRLLDALPEVAAEAPSSSALMGAASRIGATRLGTELYRRGNALRKRWALRQCAQAVVHGTSFYLPPHRGASVATIHDLSVWKWPDAHPAQRVRLLQREMANVLERADWLITDSEFTRRELADWFGWPLARIAAIPLGASADFRPRESAELAAPLQRYGLHPAGYAFFSGTIEPRKNLLMLLDAYAALPSALRQQWPLVVCGHVGWRSEAIHVRLQRAAREGWLLYLGYVPASDLPLLLAGARLFLFPSIYEGFGLPVLEAMASGVPVICSDAASLPEVGGDAARCCPSGDTDIWREAIAQGLEDAVWRHHAAQAGLARAAIFSWKSTAKETVRVYGGLLH